MESEYLEKTSKEIARLKSQKKEYWFDFDVSKEKMEEVIRYFSGMFEINVKPCKSCGGNKYDITIRLT